MLRAMEAKVGNHGRKLVLIKLADNANDDGICWPSYQHVADHCEMGRSTVKAHIKSLADAGFLKIYERNDGKSSNYYVLTIDKGQSEKLVKPKQKRGKSEPGQDLTGSGSDSLTRSEFDPRTCHSLESVNLEKRSNAREQATPEQLDKLFNPQTPQPQAKFSIPLNWRPDRNKLEPYCMNAGCPTTSRSDQLIDGIIGDWVNYWHGDRSIKSEAQWMALLAGWIKRKLADHDSGGSRNQAGRKQSYGVPQRNQDFTMDHTEGAAELGLEVI